MNFRKIIFTVIFILFVTIIYRNINAFRDGIVGLTKKDGNPIGCVCHQLEPNDTVSAVISGPKNVEVNDTVFYTLKITRGPAMAGGCDISTSLGNVITSTVDTSLRRAEPFSGAGFELTHKYPKLFMNDTLTFTFQYIAPGTENVVDTIFANGNSVNNDTTSSNDIWNYSANFTINVTPISGTSDKNIVIKSFELKQNYPNPFNPATKIDFNIFKSSRVSLEVYDISGKLISKLIDNENYLPGNYSAVFDASQFKLTSSVYFYNLTLYNESNTSLLSSEFRKMILLK